MYNNRFLGILPATFLLLLPNNNTEKETVIVGDSTPQEKNKMNKTKVLVIACLISFNFLSSMKKEIQQKTKNGNPLWEKLEEKGKQSQNKKRGKICPRFSDLFSALFYKIPAAEDY